MDLNPNVPDEIWPLFLLVIAAKEKEWGCIKLNQTFKRKNGSLREDLGVILSSIGIAVESENCLGTVGTGGAISANTLDNQDDVFLKS